MCGLAGLFDTNGRSAFDDALIRRMTDALVHRGPDSSGIHNEPGLALGHRRLAIIDLARGAQPMQTSDGALTVVFNGEIYNFLDLRAELVAKGCRFATDSDTEVLLHGWRQWGLAMLARLRGMFAFALWDNRAETLIIARDHFGEKPLHYSLLNDGTLVFGSEIKSLLVHRDISRRLDSQAVADFFAFGYIPDPKTVYAEIRKLPPATVMIAQRGRPLEVRRYWNLLDELVQADDRAPSDALVEKLRHAIECRLISDVPLGALLSGGLDSSAVVALMAGLVQYPVKSFCISFDEPAFDESLYAEAVAGRYRTEHTIRRADPNDFSLLERLPSIYDEPFGDASAIPTLAVCATARRSVAVALTGDGGDEAMAGYRRYVFHCMEERIRARIPKHLRRYMLGALANIYPHGSWLPRQLRARTTLRELSLDGADGYLQMISALHSDARKTLLSADLRKELNGYDPGDLIRTHFNIDAPLDSLQRAQYTDVMTYLPGDILVKVDRASMANSLELRAPMLDPELFAWSFWQKPDMKISGHSGKAVLKQSMASYLPSDLIHRPKHGFAVPVAGWFRGALRERIEDLADSEALCASGILDMRQVKRLARAHLSKWRDCSKPLWLVWTLDAFLRHASDATAKK